MLIGNGKHELLRGGKGDDILKGKTCHDRLLGGDQNDLLNGGKGDETLSGRSGDDLFLLSAGNDIINDFSITDGDQLLIKASIDLSVEPIDNNLLLTDTTNGSSTTLIGVTSAERLEHQSELLSELPQRTVSQKE